MSGDHYTIKCSCGVVITTCRCFDPNKKIIIEENGCEDCKNKPKSGIIQVAKF